MKTSTVKEKLISTTIALIEQGKSIEDVTIRDISSAAGVGIGLINYHFQTKENLIRICIEHIIGDIIVNFDAIYRSLELQPIDALRYLTKRMCTFLVEHQSISRISIVSDLVSASNSDNSVKTIQAYKPVIRKVLGPLISDNELYVRTQILTATIQSVFLRSQVLREHTGIDFQDSSQREEFIDSVIDIIFLGDGVVARNTV